MFMTDSYILFLLVAWLWLIQAKMFILSSCVAQVLSFAYRGTSKLEEVTLAHYDGGLAKRLYFVKAKTVYFEYCSLIA